MGLKRGGPEQQRTDGKVTGLNNCKRFFCWTLMLSILQKYNGVNSFQLGSGLWEKKEPLTNQFKLEKSQISTHWITRSISYSTYV
jgi:hypothetical protein